MKPITKALLEDLQKDLNNIKKSNDNEILYKLQQFKNNIIATINTIHYENKL